jgi:hypothetical protein
MTLTLAQLITSLVGVVLPILVAVVTDRVAHPGLKSVVLLALAALSSFLTEWLVALNGGASFDWSQAAYGVLMTFTVAVAAHFGLWRNVGASGAASPVAGVGLDSSRGAGPVD